MDWSAVFEFLDEVMLTGFVPDAVGEPEDRFTFVFGVIVLPICSLPRCVARFFRRKLAT